jgi:2-oxoglutarate ferredoxin oxidoreductase subunit alpha
LPPIGLRIERRDQVGNRIFVDWQQRRRAGAVYGGARSVRGTPSRLRRRLRNRSRSIARAIASTRRPASIRYAIVQAEDELASIGM